MGKRLRFVCFALAILRFPDQAYGQFAEAHNYDNGPVGVNQVELAYAYAHSNSSIDTSLIVAGAKFNLNQGTITYTRYFGLVRRTAWVEASVPLADLSGFISGTNIRGSITGSGDSSYALTVLLKGGPALSPERFADYKPTTTVGMSLTVSAPTGQYNQNRLLNLGSDRWSFKPEIALSQPFGREQKWQCDLYAHAYFFTDNTSYRGREILRQEALPGLEGHVSYFFVHNAWASLDTLYSFRGATVVNGVPQNDAQRNFTLGSEVNVSLNSRNTVVFQFAKALVHQSGPAVIGLAVKYTYTWGKGYR
ncbi:MAG TPA: transporter [Terriglobales bacterium]|nr:transporter [Terriglobales bacterium]